MFQNLTRKISSENPPEVDDDDISVTSTVVEPADPDQEYEVEDILAAGTKKDNVLIKWAGYPLHEATEEPLSKLSEDLKRTWAEKKKRIEAGKEKGFRLQDWLEAKNRAEEEKVERHRRRNEKRKRLGLPQTAPFNEASDQAADSNDEGEDEAAEDEFVADEEVSETTAKARSKQKETPAILPKPVATSAKAGGVPSHATDHHKMQSQPRRTSLATPTAVKDVHPPSRPAAVVASSSRVQAERPSATGYQGTARRLSDGKPLAGNTSGVTSPKSGRSTINPGNRLMAKKSAIAPAGKAGNIFTSGKVTKKRNSLRDVRVDPAKAGTSRQIDKWSGRRKLELASRGKEDLPPDADALFLFDPSMAGKKASSLNSNKETPQVSPTTIFSPQFQDHGSPTELPPEPEPKKTSEPRPGALKTQSSVGSLSQKRRKSVRWADTDELFCEPESMDIDMPEPKEKRPRLRSPTLGNAVLNRSPSPVQRGIEKRLVLGNKRPLDVVFNDFSADSRQEWARQFIEQKVVSFNLGCLAQTAGARFPNIIRERLAAGSITSKAGGRELEQMAEFLKSSLLGLFYPHPLFNLLVFPAKCDDWKLEGFDRVPEISSPLHYFIFASQVDCKIALDSLSLRPAVLPTNRDEKWTNQPQRTAESVSREVVFKRFFDFDYKQLLPRIRNPTAPDNFFLVFPRSKAQAMLSVYNWLLACNPHCRVFFSCEAGSWNAFRAAVARDPGVVIVHDILTPSFRRFPNLGRYLVEKRDEYWCFAEPNRSQPFSLTAPAMDVPPPLSSIQLNRIFALRTAILLTPSFMVSQPQQLEQFLEWFATKDRGGFNYRLVTAWNLPEYLNYLASERSEARRTFIGSDTEANAEVRGLGIADTNARFPVIELAAALHRQHEKVALYDLEAEDSRLVYADRCIDPNDEQSLVNWFGWWSSMRTDEFRKFYVVGSGDLLKSRPRGGECKIKIPTYSPLTKNDPDAVLEAFQQAAKESVDELDTRVPSNGSDPRPANQTVVRSFPSEMVPSDDPFSLNAAIKASFDVAGHRRDPRWKLYAFPVSWNNSEMATHWIDANAHKYTTYREWLNYAWPFRSQESNGKFNTFVGFFYTIATDWDPSTIPRTLKQVPRHPWLGIYRIAHPNFRSDCEIIIWDADARQRCPGPGQPLKKDLLFMQRQLIDYLEREGPLKNPGTRIKQVWLGGFDISPDVQSRHPMDTTLRVVARMLRDLKNELPLPAKVMEQKGFRLVQLQNEAPRPWASRPADDSDDVSMSIDSSDEDGMDRAAKRNEPDVDEDDMRIIFHPPRGTKMVPGQRTKCANKLYEDARLARARGPDEIWMDYKFTPTTVWYQDQLDEGRGFHFINVEPWDEIKKDLQIEKHEAELRKAAQDASANSGTDRVGSATSG